MSIAPLSFLYSVSGFIVNYALRLFAAWSSVKKAKLSIFGFSIIIIKCLIDAIWGFALLDSFKDIPPNLKVEGFIILAVIAFFANLLTPRHVKYLAKGAFKKSETVFSLIFLNGIVVITFVYALQFFVRLSSSV